ncbi:MAG: WD40 repeat domain-containing serine/threonine protein kinase [Lacipirellulaceae bacterium]
MIRPGDEPVRGYRVEALLGRGQYGEVWRATTPGGSRIALKFLDMTGRGWRELRAVRRVQQIRHAHLMPIVALWLLDDRGEPLDDAAIEGALGGSRSTAATVTPEELARSRAPAKLIIATPLGDCTLRDRLVRSEGDGEPGIPRDELLRYMEEAAKGLDHLNAPVHDWGGVRVGVQHGDVKPDNVMLTGGSVVLCDFGVAQILSEAGQGGHTSNLSGSPAYMAPEAFRGELSPTSDQYSLAITYYELRTGRLPLVADGFSAALRAHTEGRLDFSEVPAPEAAPLRKATSLDPAQRFESNGALVAALRAACAPLNGSRAVAGRGSRRRWLAPLVGGAIVAGTLAGWWFAPRSCEVRLRLGVPGMRVSVNGERLEADRDGNVTVVVGASEPVNVEALGDATHAPATWRIDAAEVATGAEFAYEVPLTAAGHAAEASRLVAEGDNAAATAQLAEAIKKEAPRYARMPTPTTLATPGVLWQECLQVTGDGESLVAGGRDGVVRRWGGLPDGVAVKSESILLRADAPIESVAIAGPVIAASCEEGSVWARRGADEAVQLVVGEGQGAKVAHAGERWLVAALSRDLQTSVSCWDLTGAWPPSTRQLGVQPGEYPRMAGVAGSGVVVATKDAESQVLLWTPESQESRTVGRRADEVLCLAVSRDGRFACFAGAASGAGAAAGATIVDLDAGASADAPAGDAVLACAVDATGTIAATAARTPALEANGEVCLWRCEVAGGPAPLAGTLQYDRRLGDVTALAVGGAGRWVAAGHDTGAVAVWDAKHSLNRPVVSFGAGDRISAVVATPDERWLFAAARDARLVALDLGRLLLVIDACREAGATPIEGAERLTLRVPPGPRIGRSLGGSARTAFHRFPRPIAGPDGGTEPRRSGASEPAPGRAARERPLG